LTAQMCCDTISVVRLNYVITSSFNN